MASFKTSNSETIFALSSGAGVAGVAVIRLSGPSSLTAFHRLAPKVKIEPRLAKLATLKDPDTGKTLDQSLALYFKAPFSFTGEDVIELHVHGGRAVVEGVLSALHCLGVDDTLDHKLLRMAEPGEFTRRAFENGKMDLTEAEGLNDLIHAQTAAQRDLALRQMDGALRNLYENWRHDLIAFLAHLEADIDFPDEDLPDGVAVSVLPKIQILKQSIEDHLNDNNRGQALRDGFRIAILGAPNAGKSSLLNKLLKSDVAIVSDEAGTTRDVIEVQLDIKGFAVKLMDTAGLREQAGKVEAEGIRRALEKAEDAHMKLVLVRADQWPDVSRETLALIDENTILVISQVDLRETDISVFHVKHPSVKPLQIIKTSTQSGAGIDDLLSVIGDQVVSKMELNEAPVLTRMRHREALHDCVDHLTRFEQTAGMDAVLAAEDVRMAVRALGSITGLIDVEDLLDVIFSDFCIGK